MSYTVLEAIALKCRVNEKGFIYCHTFSPASNPESSELVG